MKRDHNFSAGPAVLPLAVIEDYSGRLAATLQQHAHLLHPLLGPADATSVHGKAR